MAFHWSISGASVMGIARGSVSELAVAAEDRLVSVLLVVLKPRVLSFPAAELDDDDDKWSNMAVVLLLLPPAVR